LNTVLIVAALAAVIWGALAFGAVYPWAFTPLAVTCAGVGAAALALRRRGRPPILTLACGLGAIAATIVLQAVPLPAPVVDFVSPYADAFFGQADGTAGLASSAPSLGSAHALSIAPASTLLALALFVSLALFFLGMTRLISEVGARGVTRTLVAFGVVLALVGIVQYVLTRGAAEELRIYGFWRPRFMAAPFGPYVNHNHFAGWMIMVLPLALAGALGAWEAGQTSRSGGLRDHVSWMSTPSAAGTFLMAFAALVMGLSVLMSQSRSGMAAFAAGALALGAVFAKRQPTRRAQLGAAALCTLVLFVAAAWAGLDRVGQRVASVRGDAPSAGGRRQAWSDTMHIVRDFPLAGTGLDTFGTAMMLYQTDRERHFQEAHNDYLQLASEGGFLVCMPIAATLIVLIVQVRRRFREAPRSGSTYWIRVGAVVGLLSIALQSLVEFSLQMPGNAALFAVLAAIAVHQSPNLRRSDDASLRRRHV
jgi:O-antigen ligase